MKIVVAMLLAACVESESSSQQAASGVKAVEADATTSTSFGQEAGCREFDWPIRHSGATVVCHLLWCKALGSPVLLWCSSISDGGTP